MVSTLSLVLEADMVNGPSPSLYREAVDQTNDLPDAGSPHGSLHMTERFEYEVSNIVGRHYMAKIYNQQTPNALSI